MPEIKPDPELETRELGPDPNYPYPNENMRRVCFIKNVITRPNIVVGDYTYYDDPAGAEDFEQHVTHHYEFYGDTLIIGKFCAIATGIQFIMNGANHQMKSVTTYPFSIMRHGWEKVTPTLADLPFKGDTVVGNDVWIGQNVTVMPGIHIGDGAIIAANSTVTRDIPAYHIAGGNPCRIIRPRFSAELIDYLLELQWWDWPAEKIFANLEILTSGDLERVKTIEPHTGSTPGQDEVKAAQVTEIFESETKVWRNEEEFFAGIPEFKPKHDPSVN
ncbi:MAG: transferase hexapeptide repeat containing protein [Firmicutes bacterium]|nr:transferase hexapeptide repeat containing protein [Bacillota bacterium]